MDGSYQIFNCKQTNSNFKLLSELNISTRDTEDSTSIISVEQNLYNTITQEINEYNNNNKFTIETKNNIIDEQSTVNNKFIFKNGYYFCSYLYKHSIINSDGNNEDIIYITEPIYEYNKNPLCNDEEFSNIVIKNTIPLNLNIVGVIYYYKLLKNKSECKSNIFTYKETTVTHLDNEKYIIDVIYFNTLANNIYYELSYLFYKNTSYVNLSNPRYKKNLKYTYFESNNNPEFINLSNNIEQTIYNETNQLILNLNNTKKNLSILLSIKDISETNKNSLTNLLQELTKKNSNLILDCNSNKYVKKIIFIKRAKDLLTQIKNDFKLLNKYVNKVQSFYNDICEKLYNLEDFGRILENSTEYEKYRKDFKSILEVRGNEKTPVETTIYGLKTLIINLIDSIITNSNELNNVIIKLQNNLDTMAQENNNIINNFFTTIQEWIKFDINMNDLNKNITTNQLKIFMEFNNNICTVKKNNIIEKYLLNTQIIEDYTIKLLPNIYNLIKMIDNFKLNTNNILKLFIDINQLYSYLDRENQNLKEYPTLYNIFFIKGKEIKGSDYMNFINNPVNYEDLEKKYIIIQDGERKLDNTKMWNTIFKPLPKTDTPFLNLYNRRDNIFQITNDINITSYFLKYNTHLIELENIYANIEKKLIFSRNNIQNICKTSNVIIEYNKHINTLINSTKINVNSLKEQKDAKKFENLSLEEQKFIKLFIKMNKISYSVIQKYSTNKDLFISNNIYNMCKNNFNSFISSVISNLAIITDEMDVLNIYFNLKNCFEMKNTNLDSMDDFIVIVYCFCISMLAENPKDFFKIMFYVNKNKKIKNLFTNVLHNKLYLNENITAEKKSRYIKIISIIEEITLTDYNLENNTEDIQNKLKNIKNKLIEELQNAKYINIHKKLYIIQSFISYNKQPDINELKINTKRNEYKFIDEFFNNIDKMIILNFNKNINNVVNYNNYYINNSPNTTENELTKYCIHVDQLDKYNCGVCDFTKKPLIRNLSSCPPNLPYNLDSNISSRIEPDSNLTFEKDILYRIFSYISEPKKQLVYKRGRVIYGKANENDSFKWYVNKSYKNYSLLNKIDENPDDTVIIKSSKESNIISVDDMWRITNDLDKINKDTSEFYLNNFYIQNIVSEKNLNTDIYKFPNSHQLYIKKESNYHYVYFIENNIKYYMYLNVLKNRSSYDIIFREDTTRYKEPFIKNYAKWRFIKDVDYIENIFEDVKSLYNIRSVFHFNIEEPLKINGLLSYDNTCYKYKVLLNNYLNNNYDLINNTKFKFTGYNNNYNISTYIKNDKSIFNNINILQFLNHTKNQKKLMNN